MSETQAEPAGPGHNADPDRVIAIDQLRSLVDRLENLGDQIKALADDRKEIYSQAKASGFDTKVLRQLITMRAKDATKLEEQELTLGTYKIALGM